MSDSPAADAAMLETVQQGRLSAGHARAVLPLLDTPDQLRRVWRQAEAQAWSKGKPTDATVVGIVDLVDLDGNMLYKKSGGDEA